MGILPAPPSCVMEMLSNPDHEVWRWQEQCEVLRGRRERQGAENCFLVNAGALELVQYLIEGFVRDSRDMGMTPVCVMLYPFGDLRLIKAGIRLDDPLLKFLAAKGIPYVDTAP